MRPYSRVYYFFFFHTRLIDIGKERLLKNGIEKNTSVMVVKWLYISKEDTKKRDERAVYY